MLAAFTFHISNAARQWAVKELARRAGVTQTFYQSWKIEVSAGCTSLYLQSGTSKRIDFRHSSRPSFSSEVLDRGTDVIHARWMRPPRERIQSLIPDFIVPYSESRERDMHPLFRRRTLGRLRAFPTCQPL